MASLSLNVSVDKVTSVILNKLVNNDMERIPLPGVKARLMQKSRVT